LERAPPFPPPSSIALFSKSGSASPPPPIFSVFQNLTRTLKLRINKSQLK
jgi:hypothetical protein